MEKEELKNYVEDRVRLSTDSAIQTLTNLIGKVLLMLDGQKKEFDNHKKEIAIVVENKIDTKVNGKIDKLTILLNDLSAAVADLKPVKEKFDKEVKTEEVHDADRRFFLKWAGLFSAIGIILAGIKYFILNLLKW